MNPTVPPSVTTGGEQEELRGVDGRGFGAVSTWFDTTDRIDGEAVGPAQEPEFPWRVTTRPQAGLDRLARFTADLGPLVIDAGVGIEIGVVPVLEDEVGAEGAQRESALGLQRTRHAGDHGFVVPVGRHETEGSLAQADHRIELAVERELTGIDTFERGTGRGVLAGEVDEAPADVDAVDLDPTPDQFARVPARPTPDVEHPHPDFQLEDPDEVVDFLAGALGEGVPQVCRTEVVGDRLEPVIVGGGHHLSLAHRALARAAFDRALRVVGLVDVSDRLRDLVSPLMQREPRFLFGAQLVSGLGDWAGRLALAVVVFEKSDSALWTAAVTIVSLVPWIGPGQLLSTFADRFGRVTVMITADLTRAALFIAMAVPLPTAGLLTLAFLAGLCVPPFASARGAALIDVVSPDRYGKVIALFGVATQAELVAGYALGGTVIALVGARFTLVLNALTFVVSAALVAAIRHSPASDRHEDSSLGFAGVRAGSLVWRSDPLCRRALVLFVGVNMMMVLPEALVVPYADELGAPPAAAGLLAATIAVGAMIAMSVSPDHDDPRELLRLAALRTLVLSLATAVLFVVSLTWLPSIAAFALLVSGAVDAIAVPTNQVVGARLPREGRAAAMSVAGGFQYGSQAIAIAIGGASAVVIGSGWVLAGAGLGAAAAATWSLARPPARAPDESVLSPWPPPASHAR